MSKLEFWRDIHDKVENGGKLREYDITVAEVLEIGGDPFGHVTLVKDTEDRLWYIPNTSREAWWLKYKNLPPLEDYRSVKPGMKFRMVVGNVGTLTGHTEVYQLEQSA
ncbi:MAG TPA: hypothetical protein VFK07_01295 [Candidatus Paceibacterota bacterium]|nr:hypothetical protein [Candidatus Paceibacterota bacterium]